MISYRAAYLLLAVLTVPATALADQADKRPAGTDTSPSTHYCVRNAESGACEDCWSDSTHASTGGTCKMLKESTTDPNVRKGACSQFVKTDFCKKK